MISKSLRGIAVALLIGTSAVSVAMLSTAGTAEAAGVRPQVGKPLQEALALANQGKGSAAMAKVHEAERAPNLTAAEKQVISQTEQYVAVKTGDFSGGVTNATTAKAKFASDYNRRKYHDVVTTDVDYLKKYGALDTQSQLIVAQSYSEMGDYKSAMRYLNGLGDSDVVLSQKLYVAGKLGDTDAQRDAAEQLVLKGQTKYWTYLFIAADNTSGLTDPERFDIYRLRLLTGQMRNADDYSNAAQLGMVLQLPQESLKIEQAGFDAKVLSGARQQRLLDLVTKQAAAQAAQLPALAKQAEAAKTGDALVHLGDIYTGIGRADDAVTAIKAGIEKGVKNPDDAQIRLGVAYLNAKKKPQAIKAFQAVKQDPRAKVDARMWVVYARSH